MPMNKRSALKLTVGALALIGVTVSAVPFVNSLSINPKQENDAWGSCDVSELKKGETKKCGWAIVYRRTDIDISSIDKYTSLLADPGSKQSEQQSLAQNRWRSVNEDYFIFKPWAPIRKCEVKLVEPKFYYGWEPPENDALMELPFFTEPCEGRTWDTSGRLYYREGYPPERNLIVPKVQWVSPTKVFIHV
jgi:ubiquinol-cytochrome c reductase iron-sulfur subunit